MFFKRKIDDSLLKWKKETNGTKTLLIEDARRIGKSTAVEKFAKTQYKSYILIDFGSARESVKNLFYNYLDDLDTFLCSLLVNII